MRRRKKAAAGPRGGDRPLLQTRLRGGRGSRGGKPKQRYCTHNLQTSTAAILMVPYFWRSDNAVKSQQFISCRRTAAVPRKRLAGRPRSVASPARRSRTRKRNSRLSVKCIAAGPGGRPAAFL